MEHLRHEDWHAAANVVVEARTEHFQDKDGNPDYGGRSFAYRDWYGEVVNGLNLSDADRRKLLGKMRYHVGNALRRDLTTNELEDAGLLAASPHQRNKQNYENRSTPYRLVRERGALDSDEEISEVVRFLDILGNRIKHSKISSGNRAELREALNRLITRI